MVAPPKYGGWGAPPAAPTSASPSFTASAPPAKAGFGFNLDTDPGVMSALALQNQGIPQLDALLKSARERAIIGFGDPSLAQEAGFGLDPQAGDFSRQNYLSGNAQLARIDKAHELARKQIIDRLAGRGLLQSGDLGYLSGLENQSYGNTLYDARQAVLDQLSNLYSGYLNQRSTYDTQTQNARLAAIQNYLNNPDAYAGMYGYSTSPQTAAVAPQPVVTPKKKNAGDALARYLANVNG